MALLLPPPAVCPRCHGDGVVGRTTKSWCPSCRCTVCGKTTDTAPECRDCAVAEETAAKRRGDAP